MESALVITVGVVLFAFLISHNLFKHLTAAAVLPDYKHCSGNWHEEELADCKTGLHKVPQQPINTYSNLAYLAAGVLVHFHLDTNPSFVFAVTMTYLAIGSALYHATSTRWAGMLDVTGIYTVYTAIAVYAVATLFMGQWTYTPVVMFVVAGVLATVLSRVGKPKKPRPAERKSGDRMRKVIAISLGTAYVCVLIRMARTGDWDDWQPLVGSLVAFVIAYASWGLDRKRKFPITPWGHGVWHVLTAVASALVFYAVDATTSALGRG
jgi:predicted membrane channel-forming protein YqfA (hemolysin III family)